MLEMFFDDEKVFTVFERILKEKSDKICYPKICFELGIEPSVAADILMSFMFLDILKETDESEEEGIFEFNQDSIVVIGLCFFDEVVGRYTMKKTSEVLKDLGDMTDDGEDVDMKEISFEDFLKDILGDGL